MINSVIYYLEETAKRFGTKNAVVDIEKSITFDELRAKAQLIASNIQSREIGIKNPILVYLPKSCESIEAFMGILYSGNFYTPTDVDFPFEKTNSIINTLNPKLIIANADTLKKLQQNGISSEMVLCIDCLDEEMEYDINSINRIVDTDVVYTLFTSGSTGKPKGVSICSRSIIDYIDWAKDCYNVSENERIGNQAPFYFDNSTLDIYLMLTTGATLYIIPKMYFSFPAKLMDYVVKNDINMVFWVPSVLISVANANILEKMDCNCLKKILFAGEVMPNKHLNYWRKNIPNGLYSNLYGPTEITVDCTYYTVDREFEDDEPLPIGVPCRNSDVLIIGNEDTLITEANTIGELCVRGSSLALGYWDNPEKTKEVFVQNPLHNHYPEIIYKTGDLVYYNELGEIMFAGRKDTQIKHLGYRIELGEIDSAALGHPQISNVCTIYDAQEKRIIIFFNGNLDEKELRTYLLKVIPKYMVPTVYNKIDEFPYNDNGKIDRLKLSKM